jgi:transglutaminase-like putative cysteine protease
VVVSTTRLPLPEQSLALSVQESRQILSSTLPFSFDYLQPTEMVRTGRDATQWAKRYLRGNAVVREGLEELNRAIHDTFEYQQGSTKFYTEVGYVWKARKGVCQDFAHIMLSVLRTAGLPARYVCGYIETFPPPATGNGSPRLVGSVATHAWVEVLVPGQTWVALDPTNNCWCGEQHIAVSFGRDASDAAPVRGTFKGAGHQSMKVKVRVRRLKTSPPATGVA